ncbi:MAG: PD-(D/E)XK nuclease family protein [Gemmobacter sp.]
MDEIRGIHGVPPGVDFAQSFVSGLMARLRGREPEAVAAVTVWVNTAAMRRRMAEAFAARGPGLLPRLRLLSEIAAAEPIAGLPAALPPLRVRLILSRLIGALIEAEPDMAPRAAVFPLADSLAALIDEMGGEGVAPEAIAALDVADHSAHWGRTQRFLGIVAGLFDRGSAPGPEAQRRLAIEMLATRWAKAPPAGPVIVAGSSGSRGATARMMQAVAALPQGAVVLPGFDFDMPANAWDALDNAFTAEDHPQFRHLRLLQRLDATPEVVGRWCGSAPADPARNRLISLALRPAPVTDHWLAEGRALTDLCEATRNLSLIEAPTPRIEALAIALILRHAVETGRRAALVTPDRVLARMVTAALDRWRIVPDDSAGRPLGLSPPGRLLRQLAEIAGRSVSAEALVALLKHPLTHSGVGRGEHLRLSRDLELHLRSNGPAFPDAAFLRRWGQDRGAGRWGDWLGGILFGIGAAGQQPLTERTAALRRAAEALAAGPGETGAGRLWDEPAGIAARSLLDDLAAEAAEGGATSPADFAALLASLMATAQVRETVAAHPLVAIRGAREARELDAELVVLGGLTEGTWPAMPAPDPWLNRAMRLQAGLLLPERQVGLAAHDFQQAAAAPTVFLTRSRRNDETETVPARWLNRLVNLISGLPDGNGPAALQQMRARGEVWLGLARALHQPGQAVARATRPAPCPPVAQRPRSLSVTQIETLIRDPYAIYARKVLALVPLEPLHRTPDARLRGTVLHRVMELYARSGGRSADALMDAVDQALRDTVPWPAARVLWKARIARVADWLIETEAERGGRPVLLERAGSVALDGLDFRLTARPDRIDLLPDGRAMILDFKTGQPPGKKQRQVFAKQLVLEAAMAERGAFDPPGSVHVAAALYIGLGSSPKEEPVDVTAEAVTRHWADLHRLIRSYQGRRQGYVARRALRSVRETSDYDHLSRYGEWDLSDPSVPETVGPEDAP